MAKEFARVSAVVAAANGCAADPVKTITGKFMGSISETLLGYDSKPKCMDVINNVEWRLYAFGAPPEWGDSKLTLSDGTRVKAQLRVAQEETKDRVVDIIVKCAGGDSQIVLSVDCEM